MYAPTRTVATVALAALLAVAGTAGALDVGPTPTPDPGVREVPGCPPHDDTPLCMAVRGGGGFAVRRPTPATATSRQRLPGDAVTASALSPILHPAPPRDSMPGFWGAGCGAYVNIDDRHDTAPLDSYPDYAAEVGPGFDGVPGPCSRYVDDLLPSNRRDRTHASEVNAIPGVEVSADKRRIRIRGLPPNARVHVLRVYRDEKPRRSLNCPLNRGGGGGCRREGGSWSTVRCWGWQSDAYPRHELWAVSVQGLEGVACGYIRGRENYKGWVPAIPSLGSESRFYSKGDKIFGLF